MFLCLAWNMLFACSLRQMWSFARFPTCNHLEIAKCIIQWYSCRQCVCRMMDGSINILSSMHAGSERTRWNGRRFTQQRSANCLALAPLLLLARYSVLDPTCDNEVYYFALVWSLKKGTEKDILPLPQSFFFKSSCRADAMIQSHQSWRC